MHNLHRVLEQVVDRLDYVPLSQHHPVIEGHELVLHVAPQPRDQLYAVPEEEFEEPFRDVALIREELAVEPLGQHLEHFGVVVAHVCAREYKREDLAPVVADQVQFEAVAPSHRALAVSGHALEHLVGVTPEVVAHGYHRRVDECDARATAESPEVQEEHEGEEHAPLELHEAVVGYGVGEVGPQRATYEEHVVVLEVAERPEMEVQQYCHYLAVGQGGLPLPAPRPVLREEQPPGIFRLKMFAKLVNGTKYFRNFVFGSHNGCACN